MDCSQHLPLSYETDQHRPSLNVQTMPEHLIDPHFTPEDFIAEPLEQVGDRQRSNRNVQEVVKTPTAAYPAQSMHLPRDMSVFLKDNKGLRRVLISDLIYLEADGNYVEVYLRNGRVVLRNSMTEVLKCLPKELFFMVNRSQAVNVLLFDGIGGDEVSMGRKSFTLTRRYREDLLRHLNIIAGR
jgi:DNA-binding LytR/AlgR family response regulator